MSRPTISVLVVNWNTREDTLACLDDLAVSVDGQLAYEAIVVDNGSRDGSRQALAARDDVRLIVNTANRGFAAAVNQAYLIARGAYVLLLNPDVSLPKGAVPELVRFLDQHPGAAGVGPRYLNPDGSPQQHHYRLPTFLALTAAASSLRRLGPCRRAAARHRMLGEDLSRACRIEQPSASCLLLRRSTLPDGPLLDERLPIYFNDVMLAHALAEGGATLWMTPGAVAVHQLGGSTRLLGDALTRHHLTSLVRYMTYTQPRHRTTALRLLILAEGVIRRLLRRPAALDLRALLAVARGDPGPLPELDHVESGDFSAVEQIAAHCDR